MMTTSQLRVAWAPACTGPWARIQLYGGGVVTVRASIVDAVRALNATLAQFTYQTRKADTGAYNCRKITGGTGYSLHAYGIAIDINWITNPYGSRLITDMPREMVNKIKSIRTNNGKQVWGWGGDYKNNKDAMHFEVVCSPQDIASGIAGSSGPIPIQPNNQQPTTTSEEDDVVSLIRNKGRTRALWGFFHQDVLDGDIPTYQFLGAKLTDVDDTSWAWFDRNTVNVKHASVGVMYGATIQQAIGKLSGQVAGISGAAAPVDVDKLLDAVAKRMAE